MNDFVTVIGGGFAGVEAAKQLTKRGVRVKLYEMKPVRFSPAHKSDKLCELVCSNSFKASRPDSAAGELKNEMALLGSLCVACAKETAVPAGGALAVNREDYAAAVTAAIESDPLIELVREEVTQIPREGIVIVAAGPLASDALSADITRLCGDRLSFYDAAAPIVDAESIDMEHAFASSRYDRGGDDDYINCPMNKEEYEAFYSELVNAEVVTLREFEKGGIYEGCMPVEVMAKRGADTLRFGPMKPVGLPDPRTGAEPWAVVQLRRDNAEGTLYNIVGFQTHLRFPEQRRVFSMIPALANADYLRYGKMHRNTYLNSPALLDRYYRLRTEPRISFAGQMTGVEGYVESCASGCLVGIETARRLLGQPPLDFPKETAIGALGLYVSGGAVSGNFQPMNINFGLISPLDRRVRGKREKNEAISRRALETLSALLAERGETIHRKEETP